MKKLRSLLLLCLLSGTSITVLAAQPNIIDEVIWIIGDEAVLKSEVEEQLQQLQYSETKPEGDLHCLVPEQLAIQKLLLNQAAIDSITVNEAVVMAQVEQRIDFFLNRLGSRERVEENFRRTLPEIRTELHDMLSEQMTAQQAQQKIVGEIKVTPADVRAYYNSLNQDSLQVVPEQVEFQLLAINPIVPETEVNRVKEQLQSLKERVESGEMEFSSLARLYSEDPGSAAHGGELGLMGRGQLVPEYASVAWALQDPEKVSRIVESEFGYHLIQLIERRGDKVNTRHILMKPEISLKDKQLAISRLDTLTTDIQSGKVPFEKAVLLFSQDKNTRMNEGTMTNPKTGNSKFTEEDIPANLRPAVAGLKVGEISKPLTIMNEQGKETCVIVRLKSKTEAHKLNLVDDYQELKEQAQELKSQEKLNQWIKQKLTNTYVQVSNEWKNCNFRYKGWVK